MGISENAVCRGLPECEMGLQPISRPRPKANAIHHLRAGEMVIRISIGVSGAISRASIVKSSWRDKYGSSVAARHEKQGLTAVLNFRYPLRLAPCTTRIPVTMRME